MKAKIVSTLAVATALLLCGCSKQIDGQIFVSTQGGMSYKLGSVPISIVKGEDLSSVLKEYIGDAQSLKIEGVASIKKMSEAVQAAELKSNITERDLEDLKKYVVVAVASEAVKQVVFDKKHIDKIYGIPAVATTSTDYDGKFNVSINGDVSTANCYLIAKAERAVSSEKSERYYWIKKLSSDLRQTVMLNSYNTIELEFTLDETDKTVQTIEALMSR